MTDEWEIGERARRMMQNLPRFLKNSEGIWAERRAEVDSWWTHLQSVDLRSLQLPELGAPQGAPVPQACLRDPLRGHDPLIANYVAFYGACTEMGIEPGQIAKMVVAVHQMPSSREMQQA